MSIIIIIAYVKTISKVTVHNSKSIDMPHMFLLPVSDLKCLCIYLFIGSNNRFPSAIRTRQCCQLSLYLILETQTLNKWKLPNFFYIKMTNNFLCTKQSINIWYIITNLQYPFFLNWQLLTKIPILTFESTKLITLLYSNFRWDKS